MPRYGPRGRTRVGAGELGPRTSPGRAAVGAQEAAEQAGDVPGVIYAAGVRPFHRESPLRMALVQSPLPFRSDGHGEQGLHVQVADPERIAHPLLPTDAFELSAVIVSPARPE